MKSQKSAQKPASAAVAQPQLTGDVRRLAANLLTGLIHGDIKSTEAAVGAKLIEQINVSLYSEIKHMALLVQLGREAPELGRLPLYAPGEIAPPK